MGNMQWPVRANLSALQYAAPPFSKQKPLALSSTRVALEFMETFGYAASFTCNFGSIATSTAVTWYILRCTWRPRKAQKYHRSRTLPEESTVHPEAFGPSTNCFDSAGPQFSFGLSTVIYFIFCSFLFYFKNKRYMFVVPFQIILYQLFYVKLRSSL